MVNYKLISDLYDEGKTIREIAEITSVSSSTIMRNFKKNNKELRTKSEAAKIAVENGKLESPTAGRHRTESEKEKIANGRAAGWKRVDPEAREAFANAARERWNGASELDKEERQRRAGEALRVASVEGSKLEKFLYKYLTKNGYHVILHKKGLIAGEKYEIDLYLPDQKIVIEIDGPQHFFPIFGEDRLQKTMRYDTVKNGVLISNGLCVLRVKFLLKACSNYAAKKISKKILDVIKTVEQKFPPKDKRLIELETEID